MLRKGALIPSFQDRDNPRNICLPDKETVPWAYLSPQMCLSPYAF
jgi:hypothetical protein